MNSIEKLIEDGYVKVGSKSYCEYWKKGDEVVTILADSEYLNDEKNNIKEYFNKENSHKVFCCIVNCEETYLQCYYDIDSNNVEAYSWSNQNDPENYIDEIQEVVYEVAFQEEGNNDYHEEYELSKEDFAKLKSYEVSKDVYKYSSRDHLKEILTLLDKPYIDNLETDWNNEFHADLSQLKFDYGLICSYGYMDSWDELVNCCMIIDGGSVGCIN
ncbi:MAG: hypothetical protein RR623_01175 [Bacilli bacterium]